MDAIDEQKVVHDAIDLAQRWQHRASELLTSEEKGIQRQMQRLLHSPLDKVILTRLIDQSFRSRNNLRAADQVNAVLSRYGVPEFFTRMEKFMIRVFREMAATFPNLLVPKMVDRIRGASSGVIIPGEKKPLHAHLRKRKAQGVRTNINHLGEAVLGEQEAAARLQRYILDLSNPEIEYVSVKISTIYSQINALSFDHTVGVLRDRLSALYRAAEENIFTRNDGRQVPKFVNLDMESYADLEITCRAFMDTLDQKEFKHHSAGIALQAYLPESYTIQQELTAWAVSRISNGGAPVRLRIVKGANLEMERLESAFYNWPLAPFSTKREVDANYRRMVRFGMQPKHICAVNLGIASHNLFELAYAACLADTLRVRGHFSFEMLEGMADHVRRALSEAGVPVVLYTPVAARNEFINAVAYLIRRLDENTTPGNFLRCAPGLEVGSQDWEALKEAFIQSHTDMDETPVRSHRTQNRGKETFSVVTGTLRTRNFTNEPNTDWSLSANRAWAAEIRNRWRRPPDAELFTIPLVIGGVEIRSDRNTRVRMNTGQDGREMAAARHIQATADDITQAVVVAQQDPDHWRNTSLAERHEVLSRVAAGLRRARGDLIGAAAAETGKIFSETDAEVSEAVDFAEFYPLSAKTFENISTVTNRGRGVMVVISPWNFPVAIACGGITASLTAGNTVIFKPASDSVRTAWELCRCFWQAGVSQNTLQFVPCGGAEVGAALTGHPHINGVILTGGTQTGLAILNQTPDVALFAETGGKNATIVTDMADRDQAVKNVISSAFSNSGQKCSATSLLILEKPVYDDVRFRRQLVDAARSFSAGSPWEFQHRMGPLIDSPQNHLARALTSLAPGESWALEPVHLNGNPRLWSPGIKYGVTPGTETHMTELFGPVLGVMCAENLKEAISLVNATGYGLTSGLESLDPREQALWREQIQAGNLYINRPTTGAITLRQPFGGMGKSALGPGIKAGGPDYVAQFMEFKEIGYPKNGVIAEESRLTRHADVLERRLKWEDMGGIKTDLLKTIGAIRSYVYHQEQWFSRELDFFHLPGQDNLLRYLPVGKMMIRVHQNDSLFEILARVVACRVAGCEAVISLRSNMDTSVSQFLWCDDGKKILAGTPIVYQTDAAVCDSIPSFDRIRYAAPDRVSPDVFAAAAGTGFYIARAPVLMEGRIELLHYYRQQAICDEYHRYGNLGERSLEMLK